MSMEITQYKSATVSHLKQYIAFNKAASYVPERISNVFLLVLQYINVVTGTVYQSKYTPDIARKYYNGLVNIMMSLDVLIDIIVLNEGVNSFNRQLVSHGNKAGVWILYFLVDYIANCFNILLKQFVIKPFKLSVTKKEIASDETIQHSNTENELPHLTELSSTTRSISRDIQTKVQNDYIQPTKSKATKLLEPTLNTYKSVSSTYEINLNKENNNIPLAIYSTGKDLGNLTIQKFNSLKKLSQDQTTEQQEPTTTIVHDLKTN